MRTINTIKNSIVSILCNVITIIIGLVAQSVMIKTLGVEYTGINGLFNNIISMLAMAELGIGTAIIFSLYEPIAKQEKEKIKSLMSFYQKSYRVIAIIIGVIGLGLMFFLKYIVKDTNISENINIIYLLFVLDTVISYLLSYKRTILYAAQKIYITKIIHIVYLVVMNIAQIIVLLLTNNFILYVIIKIICNVIENIVNTYFANKLFPYTKEKDVQPIDTDTKKTIFNKIKGLMLHKLGGFFVLGTDNIIISSFFSVSMVGYYSNYNVVISAVTKLFSQIFEAFTPSVGDLLLDKNKDKHYSIFKNILFLNSWIYTFAACGIACMIEPFIKLWIGEGYILEYLVLLTLVINLYIQGMRLSFNIFKNAAGVFYEDRFVPLIEATTNIVASIVLLKIFGLAGVFMGTIISNIMLFIFSYPKFVYKRIFEKDKKAYCKDLLKYLITTIMSLTMCIISVKIYEAPSVIIELVKNGIIVLIIPNLIYFIIFKKSKEFNYIKELLIMLKSKIIRKKAV